MRLSDFTNIASFYEPEDVIQLSNAGFHLEEPEMYIVPAVETRKCASPGDTTSSSGKPETRISASLQADHSIPYTIHKGKIHFVSADDQESASEASVALALALQEKCLAYISVVRRQSRHHSKTYPRSRLELRIIAHDLPPLREIFLL